jgi:hypothetical protein
MLCENGAAAVCEKNTVRTLETPGKRLVSPTIAGFSDATTAPALSKFLANTMSTLLDL